MAVTAKVVEVQVRRRKVAGKPAAWSWRAMGGNGKKMGWSGESYRRRIDCMAALKAVVDPWRRGIPVFVFGDGKTSYEATICS